MASGIIRFNTGSRMALLLCVAWETTPGVGLLLREATRNTETEIIKKSSFFFMLKNDLAYNYIIVMTIHKPLSNSYNKAFAKAQESVEKPRKRGSRRGAKDAKKEIIFTTNHTNRISCSMITFFAILSNVEH